MRKPRLFQETETGKFFNGFTDGHTVTDENLTEYPKGTAQVCGPPVQQQIVRTVYKDFSDANIMAEYCYVSDLPREGWHLVINTERFSVTRILMDMQRFEAVIYLMAVK